jgi:hypothetical protein
VCPRRAIWRVTKAPPNTRATAAANSQIPSQCADQRGKDTMIAAMTPMTPMTMPAMPGTSMELDDSMELRMKSKVPSARLSMAAGAWDSM